MSIISGGGNLDWYIEGSFKTTDLDAAILRVARQLPSEQVVCGDPLADPIPPCGEGDYPYGHGYRRVRRHARIGYRCGGDLLSPEGHAPRIFRASMVLPPDLYRQVWPKTDADLAFDDQANRTPDAELDPSERDDQPEEVARNRHLLGIVDA